MIFKPRPWQKPMIPHVLEVRRGNLWSDMGSGKTSGVLTAFDVLWFTGSNFFPALVIAPLRVARGVWPQETREWDHLKHFRVSPIIGDAVQRKRALSVDADIYTINYENIQWLVDTGFWPFRTVIADESTRLKNFRLRQGGVRAAALAQVARKTDRWVNLTGTPSPNGLIDLWGQQWFLDFGQRLGKTFTAYKERWFDSNQYTREVTPKPHALEQIIGAIKDCTLNIDMRDYIDLKQPVINTVFVDLPDKMMKQYRELERIMFTKLACGNAINAETAAALTTKCLQFAAGAVYYDGDSYALVHDLKIDALESIVNETNGANLLVAYHWKHDLERIKKRFKHARLIKTKADEDDWNAGKIHIGLAHPMSAGHGLNLQHGGHHIVHFSKWWALEAFLQINERIGPLRQYQAGYDRPVFHHHITVRSTVDEQVMDRLDGKGTVQEVLRAAMTRRAQ